MESHTMPKAVWNGAVVAEADKSLCKNVEGNVYFPPDAIRNEYFVKSGNHTTCHWKGEASYYDLNVGGEVNRDAAWYYPSPTAAAAHIAGYVAFWKGVKVTD